MRNAILLGPALTVIAVLVAWVFLPTGALGLLTVPLMAVALTVLVPGAHEESRAVATSAQLPIPWKRTLVLSLSFASIWLVVLAYLIWYHLSWPNRNGLFAAIQTLALIGLMYQSQYSAFSWRSRQLPRRAWPMRLVAIGLGGVLGIGLATWQVTVSQEWFQQRWRSLIDTLDGASEPCFVFHNASAASQRGRLYVAVAPGANSEPPQFILAFGAKADLERVVIYYHSSSKRWIKIHADDKDGMDAFARAIEPMVQCGSASGG